MAAQKAKRPIGRPKMKRQPNVVFISPVEEVEVEEPIATQPPTKKSRCEGSYLRWGNPDLWPLIAQAIVLHPRSLIDVLNHLQHIRKPGRIGSPFDVLTISTMKGWCRNPSLWLATKARGLQGGGPNSRPGSHITCSRECKECEGVNPHTP